VGFIALLSMQQPRETITEVPKDGSIALINVN